MLWINTIALANAAFAFVNAIVNKSNCLFAGYKRRRLEPTSVSAQLASYIALYDEFNESNVLRLWSTTDHACVICSLCEYEYCQLLHPCAPVERVFSHGRPILRPHRSRLREKMFSNLIFLKCNTISEKELLTQAWSVVTVRPILRCNITLMLSAWHMIPSNFTFY